MNYLLVYAHPNPKSFNHAIKDEVGVQIKQQGGEVVVRDLYQLGFDPLLQFDHVAHADVEAEQELVRKADVIVFVYPVWWFSMPAILKGYIDRVLSRGFAYDMDGHMIRGLLKGKRVMIFNTTGGPNFAYWFLGYKIAIKLAIDFGIFKFCGMKVVLHKFFYAVPAITDNARRKMLAKIRNIKF